MKFERQTAIAIAHPNIALVKYWGKNDAAKNIPAVGSFSITLDGLKTTTRVCFDPDLGEDRFLLNGSKAPKMLSRVVQCLNLLRQSTGTTTKALVESENDFPTAAGLASSASGFAALVVAADRALYAELGKTELAEIARQCSGSAARSIFGGFVELGFIPGSDGLQTRTRQILEPTSWPLSVAVAITESGPKKVGSTTGMLHTEQTSPFYSSWVESSASDVAAARDAVERRAFEALAEISEFSCLKMHGVMLSARPGLVYWNGATVECIHRVRELRAEGVPVFFTIDAGPQVKAVCLPDSIGLVASELQAIPGVREVLQSGLGDGARVVED